MQAVLLVVGLRSVICLETGASFVLSVGVREAEAGVVTSYGATGGSSGPVREDDITVYYRRVAGRDCGPQVRGWWNAFILNNKGQGCKWDVCSPVYLILSPVSSLLINSIF